MRILMEEVAELIAFARELAMDEEYAAEFMKALEDEEQCFEREAIRKSVSSDELSRTYSL
jgi:2,4-dienoyl-CoA reductase-like NADH-dependent reductase (Old Yellow Enzyme family)